ncbi:lycopene beta-cyclase CrtY [Sphingomonas parva]|uniref:lycopene beta-cyclase CrtY n=1 Tax=Sphingomonas parva TaxID=2555898 RepID=UPI001CDCAD6A|nr:lycopene beta-cyclase CrtY [Sphingomonas parva]
MTRAAPHLVIVGGGLAGCLAALALAQRRPDIDFVLVEQHGAFGGNHVWSFFDDDVDAAHRWLIAPLVGHHWDRHAVHFPRRSRELGFGYNSVRSSALDAAVRSLLPPERYRLARQVTDVSPGHVVLEGGERIEAAAVIDARGPAPAPGLDLAWQKFVGRIYRTGDPHGCMRPVIMDARCAQRDGYRFLYTLPFSASELLVEDTYYSTSPALDLLAIRAGLDAHVGQSGWAEAEVVGEETGVLPVLLGGDIAALWPASAPPVAKLGLRGGFFHPTTGYSLPDAVRNAVLLTEQSVLTGPALHDVFRARAEALWRERRFFTLLNRMLFRAAEPEQRYRVLEHFYRLPEATIARFYAARLTRIDKLRILSGRPPVPVGRALAAMRERGR